MFKDWNGEKMSTKQLIVFNRVQQIKKIQTDMDGMLEQSWKWIFASLADMTG